MARPPRTQVNQVVDRSHSIELLVAALLGRPDVQRAPIDPGRDAHTSRRRPPK